MSEPLIFAEAGGRLQNLNKLSEDRKAAVLAGAVERIHELTADGVTTEDEATGRVYVNGKHDAKDLGGRLKRLREKHKPKDAKLHGGGKPGV